MLNIDTYSILYFIL